MQDFVAALLGAGLVSTGLILRYVMDRLSQPKQPNKDTQFTNMTFAGELFCGYVETIASGPDDPWGYMLEPCENPAFVIMGGKGLCEHHRDEYLLDMSKHT